MKTARQRIAEIAAEPGDDPASLLERCRRIWGLLSELYEGRHDWQFIAFVAIVPMSLAETLWGGYYIPPAKEAELVRYITVQRFRIAQVLTDLARWARESSL